MSIVFQFFAVFLTAAFVENMIFTRSLGASWILYLVKNPKNLFHYMALLSGVSLVSAAIGYPLRGLLERREDAYILIPMAMIGVVVVVYVASNFLLKKCLPDTFEAIRKRMSTAVFNGVVFGGLLVPSIERLDFVGTLAYSLGTSLGFAVAVLLVGFGIERIGLCHVPKAFRGLPVVLIYLGLLSLAFYGLVGHQLPT